MYATLSSPLDNLDHWARDQGLSIVLLVLAGILGGRLIHFAARQMARRLEAERPSDDADALTRAERNKHAQAVVQAADWSLVGLTYVVIAILALSRLGLPLSALVAPASIAGAAFGFGAQRVVQDLLGGFFIFTERQFGVGDVIRVSTTGSTTGVSGTVEEVTLRVTKLRSINGELIVVANGDLRQVTNLSKDWSQVVVDIPLPVDRDVDRALGILREVAAAFAEEPDYAPLLSEPPRVVGVESIELDRINLRVLARTLPGRQWEVGRELRQRIADRLRAEGMLTSAPATSYPAP